MPKIGIFWAYEGKVIGKARDLNEGIGVDGWVDSPDDHFRLWEQDPAFRSLRHMEVEYQDIPRGRAVWYEKTNSPVIYMDKKLLTSAAAKKKVVAFFDLSENNIEWKPDPHYTTDLDEIKRLLDS